MHDQLGHPMDRAIYWIEYVIRHKGARHLRKESRNLNFLQRGLIDVMLFLFAFSLLFVFLVLFFARLLIYRLLILIKIMRRKKVQRNDGEKKNQ